jgi:hypothetical protein
LAGPPELALGVTAAAPVGEAHQAANAGRRQPPPCAVAPAGFGAPGLRRLRRGVGGDQGGLGGPLG